MKKNETSPQNNKSVKGTPRVRLTTRAVASKQLSLQNTSRDDKDDKNAKHVVRPKNVCTGVSNSNGRNPISHSETLPCSSDSDSQTLPVTQSGSPSDSTKSKLQGCLQLSFTGNISRPPSNGDAKNVSVEKDRICQSPDDGSSPGSCDLATLPNNCVATPAPAGTARYNLRKREQKEHSLKQQSTWRKVEKPAPRPPIALISMSSECSNRKPQSGEAKQTPSDKPTPSRKVVAAASRPSSRIRRTKSNNASTQVAEKGKAPARASPCKPKKKATTHIYHIEWEGFEEVNRPTDAKCYLCGDYLDNDESMDGDLEYDFESFNPPMVAVLPCGHTFHDECLSAAIPEKQAHDPPCFLKLCCLGKSSESRFVVTRGGYAQRRLS
ncbi:Zinc finger, RING-type, eukaryotic [Dillenia turbinata]|uniref:Zinc finger, RING-type, eukaryotic n=1 Tax=Dillenia turbinata TaxID=194707 RepID=A0AAN8ZID1_9MAGN